MSWLTVHIKLFFTRIIFQSNLYTQTLLNTSHKVNHENTMKRNEETKGNFVTLKPKQNVPNYQ